VATDVHPGHLENTGSDTWITRQASHTWTQTNRARALDGAQATPKYLNANRRRSDRHPLPKVMVHLEIESGEPGTPGEHAGGEKTLRQLSWREAFRGADAARKHAEPAASVAGIAKSQRSRGAGQARKAEGTPGDDDSSPISYESSDGSSRPPTPTPSEEAALREEADPAIQQLTALYVRGAG
jgi:hypothetical protein